MYKLSNIYPLQHIIQKVWEIVDLVFDKMHSNDIHIVFFLISIYKDGFFDEVQPNNIKDDLRHLIQQDKDYKLIFEPFKSTFENISPKIFIKINTVLCSLNRNFLEENFNYVFDNLMNYFATSIEKKQQVFIHSADTIKLVNDLVNIPANSKVYNPFAGLASYAIFLPDRYKYFGQEQNYYSWALGTLWLKSQNKTVIPRLSCANPVQEWPIKEKYKLIISTPPIYNYFTNDSNKSVSYVEFLFSRGMQSLTAHGKMLLILPIDTLFSRKLRNIRKDIVENGFLDTVVSLPSSIFNDTSTRFCILLLNKSKKSKDIVRFIDIKNFFEKIDPDYEEHYQLSSVFFEKNRNDFLRFVNIDKIKELDYNLNVPRYFANEFHGTALSELCNEIRGRTANLREKFKLVNIRDLKEDPINNNLNTSKIEYSECNRTHRVISESCILVTLRWKTLKPTYFKFEGEPICIKQEILAISVDENKADPQFLIQELYSDQVARQLNSYRIGSSIIPFIRKKDFLAIKIVIPSISEQLKRVSLQVSARIESLHYNENLLTNNFEIEKFKEFASLKHSLGAPRSNILSNAKTLINFFNSFETEAYLKLNASFENQFNVSIVKVLKEIRDDINHISIILEKGEDGLKIEKYNLELVSIEQLNHLIKKLSDKNYNFIITHLLISGEALTKRGISCNLTLMKVLIENIMSNASNHGFQNRDVSNKLVIELKELDFFIELHIKNNGTPFPKNFSKEKFITKFYNGNKSKGTGIGGYDINRIAKYFSNENWSLKLDDAQFPVWFIFSFPIKSLE